MTSLTAIKLNWKQNASLAHYNARNTTKKPKSKCPRFVQAIKFLSFQIENSFRALFFQSSDFRGMSELKIDYVSPSKVFVQGFLGILQMSMVMS